MGECRGWEMPTRRDDRGEQNVLFTRAGFSRGGHFHRNMTETITVLTGVVRFEIKNTFGRLHWFVANKGSTVVIAKAHGHVFYALHDALVLQEFDKPYDQKDEIPCTISDHDWGIDCDH
jgi:dTDP-4-dehydrorhamnose 3,5-epimerase-like enzyme